MKLEQLHELVHGLTKDQHNHFSRFVKADIARAKKKLDMVLYDRIRRYKLLDEKTATKIRGKEFKKSDKFLSYRLILLDAIIQSQANRKVKVDGTTAYVEAAVDLRAEEMAGKALATQMKHALQEEDYFALLALHMKRRQIFAAYRIDLPLADGVMGFAETQAICQRLLTLENLIDQVVGGLKNVGPFRTEEDVLAQAAAIQPVTNRGCFLYHRLQTRIAVQQQDMERAFEAQRTLVDAILSGEVKCSVAYTIREINMVVNLAQAIGLGELAVKYCHKLSEMELLTPALETLGLNTWLSTSVVVAYNNWNLELIEKAHNVLRDRKEELDEDRWIYMNYLCAVQYFYHGDFVTAKKLLMDLKVGYTKNKLRDLHWPVEVILLLIYFDNTDSDMIELAIGRLERDFRKSELKYPLHIIRVVKNLWQNPSKEIQILEMALLEIKKLKNNDSVGFQFHYFNINPWIRNKLGHGDMLQFCIEEDQLEALHFAPPFLKAVN